MLPAACEGLNAVPASFNDKVSLYRSRAIPPAPESDHFYHRQSCDCSPELLAHAAKDSVTPTSYCSCPTSACLASLAKQACCLVALSSQPPTLQSAARLSAVLHQILQPDFQEPTPGKQVMKEHCCRSCSCLYRLHRRAVPPAAGGSRPPPSQTGAAARLPAPGCRTPTTCPCHSPPGVWRPPCTPTITVVAMMAICIAF